jgi:hypothetical protein
MLVPLKLMDGFVSATTKLEHMALRPEKFPATWRGVLGMKLLCLLMSWACHLSHHDVFCAGIRVRKAEVGV